MKEAWVPNRAVYYDEIHFLRWWEEKCGMIDHFWRPILALTPAFQLRAALVFSHKTDGKVFRQKKVVFMLERVNLTYVTMFKLKIDQGRSS
jgi:hypothetical protein